MPFQGIMNALQGGGPQNITPQTGGQFGQGLIGMMGGGPLQEMVGRGMGRAAGYTPGQVEHFQGMGDRGNAFGAMGQGGLIGFIQRMLARRQQQQPPAPGATPAPSMAPQGPQNIMAPQTGTGPPGAPGAVY